MISTRDLSLMSDVNVLRRSLQAAAMLDAILCPDWQYRYHLFNAAWAAGEQLATIRNGSGDDCFVHFGPAGCWVKGFAHESVMSPHRRDPNRVWPGVLDAVPDDFSACIQEPAFSTDHTTFCIWRGQSDQVWHVGPVDFPATNADPDGSALLLSTLDGRPETYRDWAREYYEVELPLAAIGHVYQHLPLTPDMVATLNPGSSLDQLIADAREIGYPSQ